MNDEKNPKSKLWYITGVFLLLALGIPLLAQRLPNLPGLRGILSEFFSEYDEGPSKIVTTMAQMNTLKVGIQVYKIHNRELPTTEQGLAALVTPPASARSQRKLTQSSDLIDPWGNPYQYQVPGKSGRPYHIWSFGPDGKNGTEDDVHLE